MYQEVTTKHKMASSQETGLSPDEKVPVQCLDDPFGFDAVVICGDKSFPLHRCTPFLTINGTQPTSAIMSDLPAIYDNERSNADVEAEETSVIQNQFVQHFVRNTSSADNREQSNATLRPVWPEDADAHYNHSHLTFTDGGAPLTMAVGGMGNYKPQQMDSLVQLEQEEWDKHPRTRMKKVGKRGGKKSRRKRRQ